MIKDNLYKNIIAENASVANMLKIISGYGSAKFTERVLKEFPDLKIELFLGMTMDGVSINNHSRFLSLIESYPNRLNVYYQVENPNTHIKLYSWYYKTYNLINFAGSANFTENGFINNRELLVPCNGDIEQLFLKQFEISMDCQNSKINEYIKFYNDEIIVEETGETQINTQKTINSEENKSIITASNYRDRYFLNYYLRKKNEVISEFKVPVLLKTETSPDTTGINAWNRKKQLPYLKQSPNYPFSKFFPLDKTVTFFTDDGRKVEGVVRGSKDRQLEFEHNIYEYISNRIGLYEKRPINFKDLLDYGRSYITLSKISDHEYLLDFSKPAAKHFV